MTDYANIDEANAPSKNKDILESERISQENDLNKILVKTEKQKICLRWVVFTIAILVVIFFGIMECRLINHIMSHSFKPNNLFTILAVAPIVAITAIIVTTLIGVSRGFREIKFSDITSPVSKIIGHNSS